MRDTCPFEERTFLQRAMQALEQEDTDEVRAILSRHALSVWSGKGRPNKRRDKINSANCSKVSWSLMWSLIVDLIPTCMIGKSSWIMAGASRLGADWTFINARLVGLVSV